MNQPIFNRRRMIRPVVCLALALSMAAAFSACKEEADITPGPTAKPTQPTVIVNNEAAEPEHQIMVGGFGEVIAEPDFSTISIVAIGRSATSEEAAAECAAVTQQVKEIASAQSVLERNLTTSGVTLSTNTRESDGAVTGYVARETITIVENDVDRVNGILSPIIDAKIIESYEVTYSLLDASKAYDGALAAAMTDAQEKAQAIADAGGVLLGQVVSVTEASAESQLAGITFTSSSISVTANLTVTFLIAGVAQPEG